MGYLESIMAYFGVQWPILSGYLDFQVDRLREPESAQEGLGVAIISEELYNPEGPSTQYSRFLVPKTLPLMAFGTSVLEYWYLDPLG